MKRFEYGDGGVLLYRAPSRKICGELFIEFGTYWNEARSLTGGAIDEAAIMSRLNDAVGFQKLMDRARSLMIQHCERYERGDVRIEGLALTGLLEDGADEGTERALGVLCQEWFFRPRGFVVGDEGSRAGSEGFAA